MFRGIFLIAMALLAPCAAVAGEGEGVDKAPFDLRARKERLPWIWQTPTRQGVPDISAGGAAGDVDRFVLAKLRDAGMEAAPAADELTWLRRVTFAITGLPPQRDEVKAFLGDASPERRVRVVDAQLASPHFGERWARHWMDVVRYAESRGHEGDYSIANAWRYRDYLVRAFNADVPYDRFVAEHIAGDLLPPRLDPATGANESVLATAWAFLGEENHSPVDIRQDECERVDNKVDVLSKAFLGLTVACARCHDHKFDAITQRDYYALCGFVLGSSFRQVRFETMEAHERAATQLAALRDRHAGAIAAAVAASIRPGVESIAIHALAAHRVLLGESVESVAASAGLDPGRLAAWRDELNRANEAPTHPLHLIAGLARHPEAEQAGALRDWQSRGRLPSPERPPVEAIVADYTTPSQTPWKSDGPSFGGRSRLAGELIPGIPDQPLRSVMPYGAASRDAFWNRLTLSPGTEADSGSLGATARAGKTILTPTITLRTGRLHYLLRGRAHVYAGVDSHLMLTGPLHGALIANFDTGGALRWMTHDLSPYAGHRAHMEFAPQGDADLDLLMVVDAAEPPAWFPIAPWQPKREVTSLREVAAALQDECIEAVNALAAGRPMVAPALAPLADWLARNRALLGAPAPTLEGAAADFFHQQDELAKSIRWDSPTAVSLADGTGVDEHVLIRGKPTRPGEIALRGLPEAFGLPRIAPAESSGRAELAAQLADPANPLVARVMLNRVWHHLFGRGIVPTVDNFGYLGERPSHPELLDHLAWQFVHEDGWSLKRLIRRLVLSDVFARSSRGGDARAADVDPAAVLLYRMPVRRLEGEAIRDSLLVISGRFNPARFGPPVPLFLTDFTVGRGRPEASGPLDGDGRRSVYLAERRNFLPTMMVAFDLPTPFCTVGRRNVTNVPAQSLVMMNDPFVRDQASVWSARLLRDVPEGDASARVAWLFETAMARPPTADEAALSLESLAELRDVHPGEREAVVWTEFCHALLNANDVIYLK